MSEIEARELERVAILEWDLIPSWDRCTYGIPRQNPAWIKAWSKVLEAKAMVILALKKGVKS